MNNIESEALDYQKVEGDKFVVRAVSKEHPDAQVYFSFFSSEVIRKMTTSFRNRVDRQIDGLEP